MAMKSKSTTQCCRHNERQTQTGFGTALAAGSIAGVVEPDGETDPNAHSEQ